MSRLIILVLCCVSTGCQHARSFLHMDSNSSSPFLGLQLSVDARDANSDKNANQPAGLTHSDAETGRQKSEAVSQQTPVVAGASDDSDFVATSKSNPQTGSLKYSLPAIDLRSHPEDAAEVADIMSRIPG